MNKTHALNKTRRQNTKIKITVNQKNNHQIPESCILFCTQTPSLFKQQVPFVKENNTKTNKQTLQEREKGSYQKSYN